MAIMLLAVFGVLFMLALARGLCWAGRSDDPPDLQMRGNRDDPHR